MVAACTSVLVGNCNVDNGLSMELAMNIFLDGDAKGDELLFIVVGVMVKLLLGVLDKLEATQLVETGTKEINLFDTSTYHTNNYRLNQTHL